LPVRSRAALSAVLLAVASVLVSLPHPRPASAAAPPKVAILVGPTEITDSHYRPSAERIADTASAAGATVDLRYCATPAEAKAATNGASIIVYLGHGTGFPNPYSDVEFTQWVNGWGLRDPGKSQGWADGDGCDNDILRYYGEDYLTGRLSGYGWSAGPITPAANFVMVYSNACYAPGAGEQRPAPDEAVAVARVANYSTPILALGGTYFATDLGSRDLVDLILRNRGANFGSIFEMGNGFRPDTLRRFTHPAASGSEAWVQLSQGPGDDIDYWYAFAGNPSRTPNGGSVPYTGTTPVGITFSDVAGSPFAADIHWLAASGITGGCGGGRFCPGQAVTREQMASFLARALGLADTGTDFFADDEASVHEANINRLAASRITGGCTATRFCPLQAVTRAEMASFLVRALRLPPSNGDSFSDDARSIHQANINALAASGITGGCGAGRFCPNSSVTRGQMAAFLHRAFGG
jgi:S-layer homology domain